MVRNKRTPSRNRNGGYDLTSANMAHATEGRSRYDSGSVQRVDPAQSGRIKRSTHSSQRSARHRRSAAADSDKLYREKLSASQSGVTHAASHGSGIQTSGHTGKHVRVSSTQSTRGHSVGDAMSEEARSYDTGRYKARNKGGKKRVALIVGIVLAVLLAGVGVAAALWYGGIADSLKGDKDITAITEAAEGEPYYVLLLGGDSREDSDEDNRTDSIMVARVDEQNQQVSLLSVPRDLRVAIDGHGHQKINAAIEFGGYDAVIKEVNEVMGININYYAFIYFGGFKELVDKLGGVTVSEIPEGTEYKGVRVPSGENVTINGEEALVLARCRHGVPADQGAYAMGDYQRTLNQRNLIKAIAKKVLASNATDMPGLISGLAECLETNMDVSKIVSLAQNMKGMKVDSMDTATLPNAGANVDGAYYAVLYQDVAEDVLENFRQGKASYSGLDGFNDETNGNDCGSSYTDGPVYSYTIYENLYGPYRSSGSSSSGESSSTE